MLHGCNFLWPNIYGQEEVSDNHLKQMAVKKKLFCFSPLSIVCSLGTSSQNLTVDRDLGKPLLVAPRVGGQVILFAVVTADPCPTIQWRLNRSAISQSNPGYTIGNPCGSPGSYTGTTSFNFTLTITATTVTTGTYNAVLTNTAGTREVPDVFVTPPGVLALIEDTTSAILI